MNKAIFIVGPTAVGKTHLSIKLAKATGGEIISCDSMQVYKRMDILSQSPTSAQRRQVKHHLVGILGPQKEYSAASFRKVATRIIKSIIKRKRVPIVVGGSGLYVKALIDGLFPSPRSDPEFRKRMRDSVERRGSAKIYDKLQKIDPCAAAKIHPNDAKRIIRALEIYHLTGRTMTELIAGTMGLKNDYNIEIFGLNMESRDRLYIEIDSRVDSMFKNGLVAEVAALKRKKISKTASQALGFEEVTRYLNGEIDLNTAKEMLKQNTRRLAKRQLTWFRADKRIKWFDISKMNDKDIIKDIRRTLND